MEIEKVTPYPSRYADEPEIWELEERYAQWQEQWRQRAQGKFWIEATLYWEKSHRIPANAAERRNIAQIVSAKLNRRAKFDRGGDYYKIGEWIVSNCSVTSEPFHIGARAQNLRVFTTLDEAGYRMAEQLSMNYLPKSLDQNKLFAFVTFAEKELKWLQETLDLAYEPTIYFGMKGIEMTAPLEHMEFKQLEACVLLFSKLIRLAGLRQRNTDAGSFVGDKT